MRHPKHYRLLQTISLLHAHWEGGIVVPVTVDQLRENVRDTLSSIRHIVADAQLSDSQKVALIDAALNTETATPTRVEKQLDEFKQNAAKLQQSQDDFTFLETRSLKLQHRVADIVCQVQFAPNCGKPALLNALQHYQEKDGDVDKNAPDDFLSAAQRAALTGPDGKFRVSLYKALLYVETAEAIKSGVLNLVHSEKYRSLDDYLIPKTEWDSHRAEYLQRAQLEDFADCKVTLSALGQALDAHYQKTNQNFQSGKNPHLTKRPNGTFHVSTPKQEEVECLSLGEFFPERKYISMLEMLATVDHVTNFLDEFGHWQIKNQRTKPSNLTESESRGPPPLRINYAVRFGHQQEGCWDESPIGGQQQVAICGLCRRTCECDRACGPGRPTARLLPGLDNAVRA